ncbi:MAG: hypothetical protein E7588_08705 [Ruminococcaceae bacterium]|nr:hypothetical protein [Oscillospiraceae bacterium]
MSVMKTCPAVFAVNDSYQIMVPVNCETLMWVKVGEETFYDHSNGIIRSAVTTHRISVPMELLDREKKYTVCWRKIIERKPYFTQTEEEEQESFDFFPVTAENPRCYHISDAHNMVEQPVKACETYMKECGKIDFLILNGDVPDHSGKIENFDAFYQIAQRITHGNIPVVLSRGNHDMRGIYAEKLADYTPTDNGRSYFTFRLGAIWGILVDCGEDKDDSHDAYGHTNCCHHFRNEQTKFIRQVIKNAETEYAAPGVKHKLVISHVPFSYIQQEPFDIEQDIYREWCTLLRENVKPDIMICGHMHAHMVGKPGGEFDHVGQPCTMVVASNPDLRNFKYNAAGFEFTSNSINAVFTNDDGEITHKYSL